MLEKCWMDIKQIMAWEPPTFPRLWPLRSSLNGKIFSLIFHVELFVSIRSWKLWENWTLTSEFHSTNIPVTFSIIMFTILIPPHLENLCGWNAQRLVEAEIARRMSAQRENCLRKFFMTFMQNHFAVWVFIFRELQTN